MAMPLVTCSVCECDCVLGDECKSREHGPRSAYRGKLRRVQECQAREQPSGLERTYAESSYMTSDMRGARTCVLENVLAFSMARHTPFPTHLGDHSSASLSTSNKILPVLLPDFECSCSCIALLNSPSAYACCTFASN